MSPQIQVGDEAPDFTLPNQSGEPITLSDFRGEKTVVLFFYPKDETRGCIAEVCSFRDSYEEFVEAGAEVIGISSDSVTSHESFAAHYSLPFTLVSDTGGLVRKRFGVPSTLGLLPGRVTYVIDRSGVVRHIFNSQVNIAEHVRSTSKIVRELQA